MLWRRREKEAIAPVLYERLLSNLSEEWVEEESHYKVRRGHVPVLVGGDDGAVQRFAVHVKLLKNPSMAELLDMGAQEFGHRQQGVLRIPCDIHHFRRVMDSISKPRS
ncbi:hypothetical protein Cni_G21024 [Canna indica]|uniref:SAUR family protein n=1 Tax=Canna indica TaxID=4628 RepID=A0AAQ3KNP9_9LILI|nr:hypothetical protein Cni_G21024 [Canna indica]